MNYKLVDKNGVCYAVGSSKEDVLKNYTDMTNDKMSLDNINYNLWDIEEGNFDDQGNEIMIKLNGGIK